jgi:hypothetical protein
MDLWQFPELIIGYGDDSEPVEAACSLCGNRMPKPDPPLPDFKDTLAALSIEFRSHVREKHPKFAAN